MFKTKILILNHNVKYFYFYNFINNLLYKNDKLVDKSDICYEIIKLYPIPNYLKNVEVVAHKTISDADNSLVFKGIDNGGKTQYFYGKNFINDRKNKKKINFLKTFNIMTDLTEEIDNYLIKPEINDEKFIIMLLLKLELITFIRLGKDESYKKYKSTGIRTLQKKNIFFENDHIFIEFFGKKQKLYNFTIYKKNNKNFFNALKILYNNRSEFIFEVNDKIISEYKINNFLKTKNISFKDLRTYGSNIIFLKTLGQFICDIDISDLDEKKIKLLISKAFDVASKKIIHSKNISKNSYIVENIHLIIKKIKQPKNISDFIAQVIDILENEK